MKLKLLFVCIFCMVLSNVSAQTIRYVKPVASGTGDGSSWANASGNLQLMINNSSTGQQVWVAAGTYVPGSLSSQPTNRNQAFYPKSNVKVYGSFAGTEISVEQRNISANPTILSGDLLGNDVVTTAASLLNNSTMTDNAYHVVVASYLDINTVFDGFTITGGYANGSTTFNSMYQNQGGGMYIADADGVYSNIVIKNCYGSNGGGGMYINNYSTYFTRFNGITITNCVAGSIGTGDGAAIYAWGTSTKSEFYNLLVADCIGESAVTEGWQMYLRNATFYNISAGSSSAYNCVIDGSPYLYNSIIGQHSQGNAIILDNAMWSYNNSIYGTVKTNSKSWYSTADVTNTGNPGFVNAANGDFRLAAGSNCINTGNDEYLYSYPAVEKGYPQVTTDITGNIRSQGTVDKGAYEYNQAAIRYVKQIATGTGDGSSWANASSDLQNMINISGTGDQIWVAKGTYLPNRQINATAITANHRDNTFLLKSGVKIYGSFAGGETTIEGRQFQANATILSGDFSGNDPNNTTNAILLNNATLTSENAHHVVVAINLSSTTVFDGFVITGGIANASGAVSVNITPSDPYNLQRANGSGIYVVSSSGLFSNIAIKASRASSGGGGIYIYSGSSYSVPRFSGLVITGCIAGTGRGYGSAIYSQGTGSNQETKAEFFNMLVTNCVGDNAVYATIQYTQIYIANATFYGVYTTDPDPIYASVIGTNSAGYVTLANSIIAQHGYPYSFNIGASSFVTSKSYYNSVYKTKRGDGTLTVLNETVNTGNPGFVNAAAGDFSLNGGSSAINNGNDSYLVTNTGTAYGYPAIVTDIAGNTRSRNTIDQGAYESNYNPNTIRYVKTVASGTGDGSSWANASSDLQLMLNNSHTGNQVWVAKGTYKPNRQPNSATITANHRDNAFFLKSGVKVYGSFAGDEATIEGRQFETNATILSGDFSGNDPNNNNPVELNGTLTSENAYHVVMGVKISNTTVFDGFVITGGAATTESYYPVAGSTDGMWRGYGGGLVLESSGGQFNNIAIRNSTASLGGGLHIKNTVGFIPRFTGLVITGCITGSTGGGFGSAFSYFGTAGSATRAEFFNMLVTNCVGQSAIRVATGSSLVYMDNATFYGIYSNVPATTTAVIETVNGGTFGLYNSIIGQHAQANPISIASGTVGTGLYNSIFGTVKSSGSWTTNNSTTNTGNPGFVNAAGGDFGLTVTSPVRGLGNTQYLATTAGTNAGYPAVSTDIIGKARLYQGTLDLGAYQYHPPCTTPDAPTASAQAFCGTATVANLTATGTDLKWYAELTGGNALSSTTALSTGTYYVSQTSVICESARTAVAVTVNAIPAAPVAYDQTVCFGTTLASLTASGTNLKWYTNASGGSALTADTALSSGTYYVTQTSAAGCESPRAASVVTVNPLPEPPLAPALQTFCGTATVADLDGNAPEIRWYAALTGGTSLPQNTALTTGIYYGSQMNMTCESERTAVEVVINPIPAAPVSNAQTFCGMVTAGNIIATGSNLKWYISATGQTTLAVDDLLATGTYYVSQTTNNCESARTAVAITVSTLPAAPTASAQIFCGFATVGNLVANGDNLKWYASENGGVEVSSATSLTTGTYYVSQNNTICESSRTAVDVIVRSLPEAPVASAQTFCGMATVANLTANGDNLKWYASETSGEELSANEALTTGIYYVSQTNTICESIRTAVQVTVSLLPEAPVASAQTFCGAATIGNLIATGINLKWYAAENGGDELASGTSLTTGIYYVSQNNTICESLRTAVTVTVLARPAAPVAQSQTFCGTATVANIVATGSNLKWYVFETGHEELSVNDELVTGTYYVSQSINGCESPRTSVQITVNVLPDAPVASAQNFCGAATVGNLVATGYNLKWYNAEFGGNILASGTVLTTGIYYVSQNNVNCESTRTAVQVVVNPKPEAPVATKQVFCGEHTVASLAATGNNIKWYAAETGGTALTSGTVLFTGTYYVSQTVNGCESARTGVSVIIDIIPVQPVAFAQTFCAGATVSNLVATGNHIKWYAVATGGDELALNILLATGMYYVSDNNAYCESQRTEVQVVVNALPAAPEASAQTFCGASTVANLTATGVNLKWYATSAGGQALASSTLINNGTYYVSQTLNACEGPRTAVQVVIAEILPAPAAQAAQVHCTTATIADLTATGMNLKWYSQAEGGLAISGTELLTAGTYYVSQTAGICESPRTAVTVTLFAGCTGLESNYCNITVPRFGTALFATVVPGATSYRFRAVSGNSVQVVETVTRYFALANLAQYNYDTTYSVSVSVLKDGEWSPYGAACNVSTMPVPSTSQLRTEFCGQVLQSLNNVVYAESLPLATGYRFRINNSGTIQVIEKTTNYFMMNEINGNTYNKTYTVDVSVRINGQWSDYGSLCDITTPAPTTQLANGYCGAVMPSVLSVVYANNVSQATAYRFRINDNGAIQVIEKPSRYFMVNEIAGFTYNKTYSVDVAVMVNDQWGNYGDSCTLATPVAMTQLANGYCGAVMTSIKSVVYANNVSQATAYRFRIVSGSNTYFITNTARYFVLSSVPGNGYGKTYTVDVAVQTGSNWGPYGATCTVSTPNAPVNRQSNVSSEETVSQVPQPITLTSYPNPYTDAFTIDMNTHSTDRVTVRTFDMNGRLVEDITVSPEELSSQKMGGRYAQGVYNVIVSQGDYIKSFKIIKK